MDLKQVMLTAVLATFGLIGAAAVIGWSVMPEQVEAHSFGNHHSGHHGDGHGWRRGGDRCTRFGPKHIEAASAMAVAHLDLTGEQEADLEPMLDVIESWRADVVDTCQMDIGSSPEGLQVAQSLVERSAVALADLQAPFDTFYAGLDDDQRAHMDRWLERHGH